MLQFDQLLRRIVLPFMLTAGIVTLLGLSYTGVEHRSVESTSTRYLTTDELRQLYIEELERVTYNCSRIEKWGERAGEKTVCLDDEVKPTPNDCIVYSFGINEDWSFDTAARDYGCHVYSFDPSMHRNTSEYSRNIHFYKVGIWDLPKVIVLKNGVEWHLLGFMEIVRMLGHTDKIIDIVKMDVERAEWNAIPQMIQDGSIKRVRQILMETHFQNKQRQPAPATVLRSLHESGFKLFASKDYGCGKESMNPCYEIGWVSHLARTSA